MKRMIKAESRVVEPTVIDVKVEIDSPIFHDDVLDYIQAALDLKNFDLPKGPVISKERRLITEDMVNDFEDFMEEVESLCEDNYDLVGIYKNVSSDHSHYYNYLAKDDKGNIIVDFRLRLRISNHDARRSREQKKNKKAELDSPRLHKLLDEDQIKKLTKLVKTITINNERFDSYDEAFDKVNEVISTAVKEMRRRA